MDPSTIVEPTMRYLGWQTKVRSITDSGKNQHDITYTDSDNIQGRIAYKLVPGLYEVTTSFTQWTPARMVGNAISSLSLLGIIGYTIFFGHEKKKNSSQRVILVAKLFYYLLYGEPLYLDWGSSLRPSCHTNHPLPRQQHYWSTKCQFGFILGKLWRSSLLNSWQMGLQRCGIDPGFFPVAPAADGDTQLFLQNLLVAGLFITNGAFLLRWLAGL